MTALAPLTQGRDLLFRNPAKDVASAREDLFGDQGSSDFWVLMSAWHYASKNEFRMDMLRKLGIHGVTARQVGPLHEQFLRIAKEQELDFRLRGNDENGVASPLRFHPHGCMGTGVNSG